MISAEQTLRLDAVMVHGENDEILSIGGQLQLAFLYRPCALNDQAPRKPRGASAMRRGSRAAAA